MTVCTAEIKQSSMVTSKTENSTEDVVTPAFVKSEIEKDSNKIEKYLEALVDWKIQEPVRFALFWNDLKLDSSIKESKKKEIDQIVAETTRDDHVKDGIDKKRSTYAIQLVDLATKDGTDLWCTPAYEPYVTIPNDGHLENYPLRTKHIRSWLTGKFFAKTGKVPGVQAIEDSLNVLEYKAIYEGNGFETYVRAGPFEDRIYVDLGTKDWKSVEITADGWNVVAKSPIKFTRPNSLLPLPLPKVGGNWEDFQKLINAADDNWILIVSWLTQAFWPRGPYAFLNITGEQGSGKSLTQRMCKSVVDPSLTPLRRPPKSEHDLMIGALSERILSFDNLSGMPANLSDAFCGLATGTSLATRLLYTDREESFLTARRPCVFNGIDVLTNRGDLLDRTLTVDLPRISKQDRKEEGAIMKEFDRVHPQILGLILDATVTGLRHENGVVQEKLPRMADFYKWVIACEPALPWQQGKFIAAFERQSREAMGSIIESDRFASAVYQHALKLIPGKNFKCTASDLLLQLEETEACHMMGGNWPANSSSLGKYLRRIAPALRAKGITIEMTREAGDRIITIAGPPKEPKAPGPKSREEIIAVCKQLAKEHEGEFNVRFVQDALKIPIDEIYSALNADRHFKETYGGRYKYTSNDRK